MLEIGQVLTLLANVGVIAGIVFLAMEVRQNNKLLAAQARYSLREYRNDIADTFLLPHVQEAAHKWAAGEALSATERSAGLMAGLKLLELWEWQYGEYAAGMLQRNELPIGAWRVWFHGQGPLPVPVRDIYEQRKSVMNANFVQFFERNVTSAGTEQANT